MPVFDIYNLVRKAISASLQLLFSPLGFIFTCWTIFAFWFVDIRDIFQGIDFWQWKGLNIIWEDFSFDIFDKFDSDWSQLVLYCLAGDVLIDFVDFFMNFLEYFFRFCYLFAVTVIPSVVLWVVWSAGRRFVKDMVS